jgi:hypothetical protein
VTMDMERGGGGELHVLSLSEYTYAPPWRGNDKYRIIAMNPTQLPCRPSFAEFCPFYDSPLLLSYQFLGNIRPSNCSRNRMRSDRLQLIYLELYSPSHSRTDSGQRRRGVKPSSLLP